MIICPTSDKIYKYNCSRFNKPWLDGFLNNSSLADIHNRQNEKYKKNLKMCGFTGLDRGKWPRIIELNNAIEV